MNHLIKLGLRWLNLDKLVYACWDGPALLAQFGDELQPTRFEGREAEALAAYLDAQKRVDLTPKESP